MTEYKYLNLTSNRWYQPLRPCQQPLSGLTLEQLREAYAELQTYKNDSTASECTCHWLVGSFYFVGSDEREAEIIKLILSCNVSSVYRRA